MWRQPNRFQVLLRWVLQMASQAWPLKGAVPVASEVPQWGVGATVTLTPSSYVMSAQSPSLSGRV